MKRPTTSPLRTLHASIETFPVAGAFTIARSSVTHITVVTVILEQEGRIGRGECRPYPRYEETPKGVLAEIETHRALIASTPTDQLLTACATLTPGAAANAIESACVDLMAKLSGQRAWQLLDCPAPTPRLTAYTLSADTPDNMAAAARAAAAYPLLKVKIDADRFTAQLPVIFRARPDARYILDANEALSPDGLVTLAELCPGQNVVLIEQPLPAGSHARLPDLPPGCPPVCADESLHTLADLPALKAAGYRAVNVKLDKAGGPARGLALIRAAQAQGFTVMAGCMVGTSLAMAPMVAISMGADVLDLDGPLLLAKDRQIDLEYRGPTVGVPTAELWG